MMNFKNFYKEPQYGDGKNFLTDQQMSLINEIIFDGDSRFNAQPIETVPYNLGSLTNDIYLATIAERDTIAAARFKDEEIYYKQLCDNFKIQCEAIIEKYKGDGEKIDIEIEKLRQSYDAILDQSPIESKTKENLLGWFEPDTLHIKICLDGIVLTAQRTGWDLDTIIANVVLHELSHALMHNPNHLSYVNFEEKCLEESLANKIMLEYMSMSKGKINFVETEQFVKGQSLPYYIGYYLYQINSSDWEMLKNGKTHINQNNASKWLKFLLPFVNTQSPNKQLNTLYKNCFKSGAISSMTANTSSLWDDIMYKIKFKGRGWCFWDDRFRDSVCYEADKKILLKSNIKTISSLPQVVTVVKRDRMATSFVIYPYVKNGYVSIQGALFERERFHIIIPEQLGVKTLGQNFYVNLHPTIFNNYEISSQNCSLIAYFDNREAALRCELYLKTKFLRFIIAYFAKNGTRRFMTKKVLESIPVPDFNNGAIIDLTTSVSNLDCYLYNKFSLSTDEIDFIENTIIAIC